MTGKNQRCSLPAFPVTINSALSSITQRAHLHSAPQAGMTFGLQREDLGPCHAVGKYKDLQELGSTDCLHRSIGVSTGSCWDAGLTSLVGRNLSRF